MANYETAPPPAEITFLFSNHAVDNYPRILDAIEQSNPNIVAVELVGESPADRAAIEREVNAQLGGAAPSPEIEIGWFEEDVITRFAGTGIQYALIDISSDHSAWVQHLTSIDYLQDYEGQQTAKARKDAARKFIANSATSMAQRDQHTADMLSRIAHDNPGKRITAVVGAMHTSLSRRITPGIALSRQFVNSVAEEAMLSPGQKARFNAHEAGRRAYIMGIASIDEIVEAIVDDQGFIRDYQPSDQ